MSKATRRSSRRTSWAGKSVSHLAAGVSRLGATAARRAVVVTAAASAMAIALIGRQATAANLTWDPGVTGTASGGGVGTWNLNTTGNWYNGATDGKWTDSSTYGVDTGIFNNTTGAVTLNSSLSALGLQFLSTGYTISGSGTLTLGSGGINATTLTSGTTTIGNALSLQGGESWTAGAGATVAASGTITRNVGSTLNFSSTGTFNGAGLLPAVGTTVDGWATIGGTDWAVSNGATIVGFSTVGSYVTTTTAGTTAASYTGNNIDVTSSPGTLGGVITANSLRFNTAAAETVTLAAGANIISSGGILVTSTVGNNLSTITGGTIAGASNADLVIIQNNASNALTISSVIANNGTSGLTKSGAGVLNLTANNTFTGTTNVNAGTLNLSTSGQVGTLRGTLNVNSGGTVNLTLGDALGYSGGAGYVPTVNVNGGTVNDTSGANEGYTTNFVLTGGTMASTGGLFNFSSGFGITSNASSTTSLVSGGIDLRTGTVPITVAAGTTASGVDLSITGVISDGGALSKSGAGVLSLGSANPETYTGGTTVNGGVLKLTYGNTGTGAIRGTLTINTGGTVTLAQHDVFGYTSAATGLATVNINGGTLDTSNPNNNNETFTGVTVNMTGGFWTASNANSYFQPFSNGFGNTTINSLASNITSTISTRLDLRQANLNTVFTVATGTTPSGVDLLVSGAITQSTAGSGITKAGTGLLALTGVNSYSGVTTVTGGTLEFLKETSLYNGSTGSWTASNLIVSSGATAAFGVGASQFTASDIATLSALGSASTGFESGSILGLDTTAGSFSYGNILANPYASAGGLGLTKLGTNTLTLTAANTYSGATSVNAGTLDLANQNAVQNSTLTMNGGSLTFDQTVTGNAFTLGGLAAASTGAGYNIALQNNATSPAAIALTVGGNNATTAYAAVLSGAGSLTKAGTGTLTLTGVNTFTGGTTVNASSGTLIATVNTTQNSLGTGAAAVGASSILELNNTNATSTTVTIANTFTGTGTLDINFTDTTATNTLLTNVTGFTGTIVLSNSGTNADKWNAAGLGTIGAALNINSGSQLLVASGTTTFSNGITVSGMGNSETRGAIRLDGTVGGNITLAGNTTIGPEGGSLTGNITSGAGGTQTLTVGTANSASTATFSGNIGGGTGAIALTVANGTLTLSGTNTYTGVTTVTGGTLEFLKETSLYNGSTGSWTASNLIVSSGATAAFGVGASQFTASDIATLSALGSASTGFESGSILGLDTTAGSFSYGNILANPYASAGGLGLTKLGTNTLTLTAANTYSGATSVNAGTLDLANQNAVQNSTLTMNGGSLTFDQTVTGNAFTLGGLAAASTGAGYNIALQNNATSPAAIALTVGGNNATTAYAAVLSGAGSLTKAGTGTLTLSNAGNSFTGNVVVSAGTLATAAQGATNGNTPFGNTGTAGRTITINSGGTLSLNTNNVFGDGTLTVANFPTINVNGGTLIDNAYNDFGNMTLTGAAINIVDTGTDGTYNATSLQGTITVNGSTPSIINNTSTTDHMGLAYSGGGQITFNVGVTNGSGTDLTVEGNFGFANELTGTGGIIKSGSGTMLITAPSTYTGATTINAGTLALGTGGNLAATAITVNSGATFASRGGSTVAGSLTLAAGSNFSMVDGTTSGTTSTLTITGASTLAPASGLSPLLTFDLGGTTTTADELIISGIATVGAAGAQINIVGFGTTAPTAKNYTIITGAATSNFSSTDLTLASNYVKINGLEYSISLASSTATTEILTVGSQILPSTNLYWAVGSGIWGTASNWNTDATSSISSTVIPTNVSDVYFTTSNPSLGGTAASTLDTNYTVNSLNFVGATAMTLAANSTFALTINNGGITDTSTVAQNITAPINVGASQTWSNTGSATLTVGTATITNNAYNLTTSPSSTGGITISGALAGIGNLVAGGTGTTTLSAVNTYTGTTTINSGATLLINSAGSLGSGIYASAITNNGTLNFGSSATQYLNGVISGTGGLTMSGTGVLLLGNSTNTYTGGTTISAGSLLDGNSGTGLGGTAVGENTAVFGTGTINVTGGILWFAPGSSPNNFYIANPIVLNGGIIRGEDGLQHLGSNGSGTLYSISVGSSGGTVQSNWTGKDVYLDGLISGTSPAVLTLAHGENGGTSSIDITDGSNTFSGTVAVNGNGGLTLNINNATALQFATLNLNPGTAGTALLNNTTGATIAGLTGTAGTVEADAAAGTSTLTVNEGTSTTYGGTLINNPASSTTEILALTKSGAATLTLSGANTYTGATNVTGGILQLGAVSALGTASATSTSGVTVSNGAALDLNSITPTYNNLPLNLNGQYSTTIGALTNSTGTAVTYGGAVTLQTAGSIGGNGGNITLGNTISGANGLTKVGSDTLLLTGATNGSTTTTISGGTLQIGTGGSAGVLGSGAINFNNGATLAFDRGDVVTQGSNFSSSPITGNGNVTQMGGGVLVLNASNTYSGATNVTAGTLIIDHSGANTGALTNTTGVSVSGGATLQVKGTTSITVGNLSVAGGATTPTKGTLTLADGTTNTLSIGGNLTLGTGSNGSLLTFDLGSSNGANDSLAVTGTVAENGTSIINLNVLSSLVAGTSNYTLISSTGGGIIPADFSLGTTPAGFNHFSLTTNSTSNALVLTLQANATPPIAYWTGRASVTNSDSLNNWGTQATVASVAQSNWSSTSNGQNDPQQVPGGTTSVIFTASNATGSTGTLTTTLDSNYSIGGLTVGVPLATAITSTVINTSGNTLTFGAGGLTVASASDGSNPNASSLTINGTGSVALAPTSSTWANNNATLGLTVATPINATAAGASTLTFSGSGAGGITLGGAIGNGSGLNASLALVFSQAGVTQLNGANTYTGGTTINSGATPFTVQLGNATALGSATSSPVVFGSGSNGTLALNGNSITITDLNTNATVGTPVIENNSTTAASTLTINTANSDTFAGVLKNGSTPTLGLAISGGGTLTLPGANTYTGATSIGASSILQISGAGSLGSGSYGGAISIGSGGSLQYTSSTAQTLSGVISGTGGGLTVNNSATTVTLTVADTYSGATLVSQGTLDLAGGGGSAGEVTNSAITVSAGALLELGAGDVLGYADTNSLTVFGSIKEISANSETLFRPITLSGGTITANPGSVNGSNGQSYNLFGGTISTAASSGTSFITLPSPQTFAIRLNGAAYGSFSIGANSTLSVSAILANYDAADPLLKNGAGTMILSGVNTYTGGTTVSAGTLQLSGSGTLGATTGALTISGGTLDLNATNQAVGALTAAAGTTILNSASSTASKLTVTSGTAAGLITDNAGTGGTVALTKSGSGTLTINSINSYSGGTLVQAGTLAANNLSALGTGPITISGGTLTAGSSAALGSGLITLSGGTLSMQATTGSGIGIKLAVGAAGAGAAAPGISGTAGVGVFPISGNNWNNYSGTTLGVQSGALTDAVGKSNVATLSSYSATNVYNTGSSVALLDGYLDNTAGPDVYNLTNIPYSSYEVIAYFDSDGAGRTGHITIGAQSYYYTTMGPATTFTQTTDTTGATNPSADYAIFTGVTGSSLTIDSVRGSNNSGLTGFEIVDTSNTFANAVNVTSNSTLDVTGRSSATITGVLTIANNTLNVTGGSTASNTAYSLSLGTVGGVTLTGSPTFNVANNGSGIGTLTLGTINGSANGITKNGAGTLVLSGSNNYSGGTTVNLGTLTGSNGSFGSGNLTVTPSPNTAVVNSNNSLSSNAAVLIGTGGTVNFTGANETIATLSGTGGTAALGNAASPSATMLTIIDGGTFNGNITDQTGINAAAIGSLVVGNPFFTSPSTVLSLGGNNTYTGGTTIAAGILSVSSSTALGTGNIAFSGGTLQYAASTPSSTDYSAKIQGSIAPITIDTNGNTVTFASSLISSNAGGLTLSDSAVTPGTLVLAASNAYNGGTLVTSGTLQLSGAGTLGNPANNGLIVNGGSVDLNATSQSVSSLNGTGGTITNTGNTSSTLTVGSGNGADSYAGVIQNGAHSSIALTKTGLGSQTLSGANGYTGSTLVNAGTLSITGSLANTPVTVTGTGSTLSGTGTIGNIGSNLVSISGGGTIAPGAPAVIGTLTTGNQTWGSGGTYDFKTTLASGSSTTAGSLTAGTQDFLKVNGTLDIESAGNQFTLDVSHTSPSVYGGTFIVAHATTGITWNGSPSDLPNNTAITSDFTVEDNGVASNNFAVTVVSDSGGGFDVEVSPVPEPGSLGLFGLASLGLLRRRRANRRRAAMPASNSM